MQGRGGVCVTVPRHMGAFWSVNRGLWGYGVGTGAGVGTVLGTLSQLWHHYCVFFPPPLSPRGGQRALQGVASASPCNTPTWGPLSHKEENVVGGAEAWREGGLNIRISFRRGEPSWLEIAHQPRALVADALS